MILTDSTAAEVGTSNVRAIAYATATFHQFMCYAETTVSRAISGAIGVVKNGDGSLTLSGNPSYTGPTQINSGSLIIANPAGAGVAASLSGVISGGGSLVKSGFGTLVLLGNNTYSGGTSNSTSAGTFDCRANNALGIGLFSSTAGGTGTSINSNLSITLSNPFTTTGRLQFRTTGANTYTVSGNISGIGNVDKTGNGTVILTGNLSYTGSTVITSGFLRAIQTVGASTATATFQSAGLSLVVSFNVAPPSGITTFRFFQGSTTQTYATVTLTGLPVGSTAIYTSATSTLAVTVP